MKTEGRELELATILVGIMAALSTPLNWYTLTLEGRSGQPRPVRASVHGLGDGETSLAEISLTLDESEDILRKVFEYPKLVECYLDALRTNGPAQRLCAADGISPIVFERERLVGFGFYAQSFEMVDRG